MRRIAIKGAYCALLERVVPGLEEVLYRRLERLDVKVTMHALREGVSTPWPNCAAMKRPRPAVEAELAAGRPSVIVLGARLNSDKRFCKALIQRVVGIFHVALCGRREDSRPKKAHQPLSRRTR